MRATLAFASIIALALPSSQAAAQWTPLASGTTASLRGLSVVSSRVAWASGSKGTVVRTTDGGKSWQQLPIPDASALDIRAVHARSERVAHAAATAGRIWRTTDGGRTWKLRWQSRDTTVFLDAIDFWDDKHGIVIGDPMDGRFFVLTTSDGGESWHMAPTASRPVAEAGEAAFAASGTSLVVGAKDSAFLGTGGSVARLHVSGDRGRSWRAIPTPVLQGGASRGIFSVGVAPGARLLLVGGDYAQMDTVRGNFAATSDRLRFDAAVAAPPRGYRSGVALYPRGPGAPLAIAVGPTGSDVSSDNGAHWTPFDSVGFHAVRASRDGIFFASGSGGRIATFNARRQP